jgi:MarR family transcriptional regulator, transcriptional regulator for hemolysin
MALQFLSPLHKASRQMSVYLEARMRALGISPFEGHVITYVRVYAPMPMGELVRVFGIKQSTLTSMLHRLERAGLVRREVNPADRRSFLVHATGPGIEMADTLDGVLQAFEAEIRSRVSDAEMEGFRAVMASVEEVTRVKLRER